jgi:thiamine pyrophosphate-dependent acetolactate synthase large subunit-like protein
MLTTLSKLGVRKIFGIVGREADSIMFDECSEIDFVLTRHEANAGFMAVAASRFTGEPQVCFSTLGPGSTNLTTALATAMLDRYPLICIAAQIETHERAFNFAHQCVDGVAINRPVAKFSYEMTAEDDVADVLRKAFRAATEAPAGPAFISIPNDILKKHISDDADSGASALSLSTPATEQLSPSNAQRLAEAAELLNSSAQPLLVVGDAATRGGCTDLIADIARRCNIPVVSSYAAKGALPPNDPLYYGPITPHMDAVLEYPALEEVFAPVDSLLLIGYDVAEHLLPAVWSQGEPKTVIRMAEYENPTPEHVKPDLDLVVNSLRESLQVIGKQLTVRNSRHPVDGLTAHIQRMAADRTTYGDSLLPQQVIGTLNDHHSDYILCSDVGYHRHVSALFFRANRPLDFVTSAGLSSFGTGLPFGIGAKLTNPEREVVVVAGDTGFHSSSAELETAARFGLKLTVIVYQNCKAGLIERYQQIGHGRINPAVLEYTQVDFAALAVANGCQGIKVANIAQLEPALKRADEFNGPTVIELPIDYPNNYVNAYTKNFHER